MVDTGFDRYIAEDKGSEDVDFLLRKGTTERSPAILSLAVLRCLEHFLGFPSRKREEAVPHDNSVLRLRHSGFSSQCSYSLCRLTIVQSIRIEVSDSFLNRWGTCPARLLRGSGGVPGAHRLSDARRV